MWTVVVKINVINKACRFWLSEEQIPIKVAAFKLAPILEQKNAAKKPITAN